MPRVMKIRRSWFQFSVRALLIAVMFSALAALAARLYLKKFAAVGLWAASQEQVERHNSIADAAGDNVHYLGPAPFYFDGETVTMTLLTEKVWEWHPEDDHYRLRAKWVGDDLYWLAPFGGWVKLATFRAGAFEAVENDLTWQFEKIPSSTADERFAPLLMKRPVHDYSITRWGYHDPSRLKDLDLE